MDSLLLRNAGITCKSDEAHGGTMDDSDNKGILFEYMLGLYVAIKTKRKCSR